MFACTFDVVGSCLRILNIGLGFYSQHHPFCSFFMIRKVTYLVWVNLQSASWGLGICAFCGFPVVMMFAYLLRNTCKGAKVSFIWVWNAALTRCMFVFSPLQVQKSPGRLSIQGMLYNFCAWSITVILKTQCGTVLTSWKLWLWLPSILDHPRYVNMRQHKPFRTVLLWKISFKEGYKLKSLSCSSVFYREVKLLKVFWLLMVQQSLKGKAVLILLSHASHILPRNKCGISCTSSWWTVFSTPQQTNKNIHLSCFLRFLL